MCKKFVYCCFGYYCHLLSVRFVPCSSLQIYAGSHCISMCKSHDIFIVVAAAAALPPLPPPPPRPRQRRQAVWTSGCGGGGGGGNDWVMWVIDQRVNMRHVKLVCEKLPWVHRDKLYVDTSDCVKLITDELTGTRSTLLWQLTIKPRQHGVKK